MRSSHLTTFVDLMVKGRLDLTVEWLVVNERKWDSLFTDETRTAARNRLGTSSSIHVGVLVNKVLGQE